GRFGAKAWAETILGPDHSPRLLPQARVAFRYAGARGVTMYQEFTVHPNGSGAGGGNGSVRGGQTAQFRTRVWNPADLLPSGGYVADFTRAFVRVPVAGLDVTVGRHPFYWGPGRSGGLTLSDASPALDGVSLSGRFGPVLGTAVFATLNRMWHDDGDRRYLARRYFSAHRVHWRPSDRLEIGVMDTVLYGGDLRQVEPYYLNPVLPFYASQFNATSQGNATTLDDNAMIGADIRWTPSPGWSLYAEALIDDFAYDPGSDDPDALAWMAGFHRAGVWEKGEARVEYARVGRYAYTHLRQENQYTHYAAPLGHELGNDADTLAAEAAWWLSAESRVALRIDARRKGDSGIDDRYRGEADTAFLAGAPTRTRSVTASGWRRFDEDWLATGSAAYINVRARDNIRGNNAAGWEWRGTIGRRLYLDR
ncbi:MAG: capsule assembly Wzi family protein, partial [Candidatus Poribacteria bacterium]